jgi:2,5-dihydroxypyridine 5,6-dioxygenase
VKSLMFHIARLSLVEALQAAAGDTVLIVHDGSVSDAVLDAYEHACWAINASSATMRYERLHHVAAREFGIFPELEGHKGVGLPSSAIAAMRTVDVVVILNGEMSLMFDDALRDVVNSGGPRVAWAPYFSEDVLLRLMPQTKGEWEALVETSRAVATQLQTGGDVVVATADGCSLALRVGEHRVNCSTGVLGGSGGGYGGIEVWPGGQVSTVPDLRSANGFLTMDRSVNAPVFKALEEPIRLEIHDGRVTAIDGGREGRAFDAWLRSLDDENAYNLTELGLGTNARCRLAGVAAPCEDTHTLGVVSFALGADVHLGGHVSTKCHVDMTARQSSLSLNGQPIVDSGRLLSVSTDSR